MSTVYLALGSNLGDRLHYIKQAVIGLEAGGLKVLKLSTIIETNPLDAPPQGRFLNGVLKAQTDLSPEEVLFLAKSVEHKLGRVQKIFRGPRVIDIDILLYDDVKLTTPTLLLPHPRMFERPFVMKPLQELDPLLCALLRP
jgi:2-amino-4-hydroxy-6-hydroxymethyldihydropteridine diphosphokinase